MLSRLHPTKGVPGDRPRGMAAYVKLSVPTSLVIRPKNYLLIDICLIIPNFLFSPSSLHFRPDFSPLPSFLGHFSLLPILFLSPLDKQVLCIV